MKYDNGVFDTPMLDFGQAFGDYYQPCDYTPVKDSVEKFIPTVAGLIGRAVRDDELVQCERMLRKQYTERHPLSHRDRDEWVYSTPWAMSQGAQICIRVGLIKRTSIIIEGAAKKVICFELCTSTGEPLGTMRSLPWHIDNYKDIAHAVRAVMRCRFQHELLGSTLACSWMKTGASESLPCTIYLGDTPEGDKLSIRFSQSTVMDEDGLKHTRASLVVEGEEISLQSLLPPIFKAINPDGLDFCAFDEFNDMVGHVEYPLYADWISVMKSRYDYLASFQNRHRGQEGILPVVLQGGVPAEIFHSGVLTNWGEAVYGLCRDRGTDGRWTNVNWVYANHLRGVGVTHLPTEPNWNLEWRPFDVQIPIGALSRHVLEHASRWAPPMTTTGKKDNLGYDVFVNNQVREEMFDYACEELESSLSLVRKCPEEIAYGYYHPAVDHVKGECSPVSIFIPGFFKEVGDKNLPQAVFALRLVNQSTCPCYEIPTILPVSYVKRAVLVLGLDSPTWVSEAVNSTMKGAGM